MSSRISNPLMNTRQVAKFLGVPPNTVVHWRKRSVKKGPRFIRIGKHVRYSPRDVFLYLRRQRSAG